MGHMWSEERWNGVFDETADSVRACRSEHEAWQRVVRQARAVLRTYSTSFFTVTRFLPPAKRAQVEVIYSAVRYPDEIVDTFPWPVEQRVERLQQWSAAYETGLNSIGVRDAVAAGVPGFLAAFCEVVRNAGIPPEHYRSFLGAMRMDVHPRPFRDMEDLIESYVFGSATVVGYFLTYVYGAPSPSDLPRALIAARDLGIALQLTNFLRDVAEDQRRGRLYVPMSLFEGSGIDTPDALNPGHLPAFKRAVGEMAAVAEHHYALARDNLDAFAADCRLAIHACIQVYGELNRRIAASPDGIQHRESVPFSRKFALLPASKYWRLPIAFLTR